MQSWKRALLAVAVSGFWIPVMVGDAVKAEADEIRLPEGAGLATRYPGDQGIAADPRVLLAEDFETGGLADLARRWESG